ncbi:uncharacterized protein LOC126741380 [Anthonomus grandis grandis]|uniref:uncharacterized protein LOC126741380 n=1 Tax=Anthonomus grandis grandis TaxID=2921223 RepID=UPI002166209B|nr:uncharacterized protein LOC126741380 [Anthonomus grandis grandis]
MVSNRYRYASESTSDDETIGDMDYSPHAQQQQQQKPGRRPTRTPKCFTKNALMARENRLKKKMYITNLEQQVSSLQKDNKKLSHTVSKQQATIDELTNEVKYLKSILANSEGIGRLIRAINASTGMAVTTSLDKDLKVTSRKSPIAEKLVPESKPYNNNNNNFDISRHPWEETRVGSPYVNYPTPESNASCYGSPEFEELNNEGLLLDLDIPLEMDNEQLLDMIDEKVLDESNFSTEEPVLVKQEPKQDEDVGICLHVSQNKVSLEFCPSCSATAQDSWKTT